MFAPVFLEGQLKIVFACADTLIEAEYTQPEEGSAYCWFGTCTDLPTKKREVFKWSSEQMTAVLALTIGVGEDNIPGYDVSHLYSVVEPLFKGWPRECRPVP